MAEIVNELDSYFSDSTVSKDVNKSNLENLRNWVNAQLHLPPISDHQISIFLHSCYGASEFAKSTIDNYYTIRTLTPELFSGRNAHILIEELKIVYLFKLPGLSVDNYQIIFGGFNDKDPEKIVIPQAIRLFFSLVDIYTNLEPFADGWIIVLNASGFAFGHFVKLTTNMGIIKKTLCYLQDALPIRLKAIHVFNAIPLVSQFVALIKPFMKKELFNMIHIHTVSDSESLYKFIAQENLPSDVGGKCHSIEDLTKVSAAKFEKYNNWFLAEEKMAKTNESKRTEKVKAQNEIFGVDGSFKKLSFD